MLKHYFKTMLETLNHNLVKIVTLTIFLSHIITVLKLSNHSYVKTSYRNNVTNITL